MHGSFFHNFNGLQLICNLKKFKVGSSILVLILSTVNMMSIFETLFVAFVQNCVPIYYFIISGVIIGTSAEDFHYSCNEDYLRLPTYNYTQVQQHNSAESGIWVSYQCGVYDISDFIQKHPGGVSTILAGAGQHLDPFWNVLPVHKHQRVYGILEAHRIGNFDRADREYEEHLLHDPFIAEQNRSHLMEIISNRPYNAHANPKDLSKSFITPNEYHYVRLHLPVPEIEISEHTITINTDGLNDSIVLTMDVIQKSFGKQLLNVTLQCSGNRRSEMSKIKQTHGVSYKHTAISTATWGGVWLLDILKRYKFDSNTVQQRYVNFEGYDADLSGTHFGASIPSEIVFDPESDLLLAYEMNGVPLPPDHGYPIRLIVPGMAGFKSVKFLYKISFSDKELDNAWETRMYRFYRSDLYWDNIDYTTAPSLLYTNVQSAILQPVNGAVMKIQNGSYISVMGYAFGGGGNGIRRVDVTPDEGQNWIEANITQQLKYRPRRNWAWVLWEARIKVSNWRNTSSVSIACRAFDNSYNSQPKDPRTIWNMMGVLVNHWHSVFVKLEE